ncbi:Major facilitator superfamily [Botryosphaeria dothidea]|uniref:Major facilitator superfamily n=1 Tax=Botryosphaeria dothidea TaxID=55169 RepID=A0A8H4J1V7_9PEZI|nr:Major facilitator superfamily [Botryosphaeria dothidea]
MTTLTTNFEHSKSDSATDLETQDVENNHNLPMDKQATEKDSNNRFSVQDGQDPNLVDWDGPDDLTNPMNWPYSKRLGHVVMASITSLFANLASTAIAPASKLIERDFGVTNNTVAALIVSIYLLGSAFGPLVIAPLSEHFGRLNIYRVCMVVTLGFLVGCSEAQNLGTFLAFRLITGIAGSGPGTIGGATIADVIPPENRGKAMSAFGMGLLMGPVLGPLMVGFAAEYLSWRWVFRILYITVVVVTAVLYCVMRETYGPVILKRKAERLRRETGNLRLYTKFEIHGVSPLGALWIALQRPSKMLIFSPITFLLSVYFAFVFGLLILLFTTLSSVYSQQYGFSVSMAGLSFLGSGLGSGVGLAVFGALSDKVAKKV